MVTTAEEEPEPIGAVAAFGGRVEALTREVTHKVSYGETRLVTPIVFTALALIAVVTNPNVWMVALGVASLLALTIWSVVEVVRPRK